MTRFTLAVIASITGATTAMAGGLDRSGQSVLAIFDDPTTAAVGLSYVTPDVTGSDNGAPGTYDVGGSYTQYSFSFTNEVNDRFGYSVIVDQPFGADVLYNANPATSNLGGTKADLSSNAISFIGKYQFNDRFSVFGGLRAQRAGGQIALNGGAYQAALGARVLGASLQAAATTPGAPNQAAAAAILGGLGAGASTALAGVATANPAAAALTAQLNGAGFAAQVGAAQGFIAGGGYNVNIEQDWGVGVTLGGAYEIPEIALRLAVTYHSEVTHDTTAAETASFFGPAALNSRLAFQSPQSVNIDFQTGINPKTLVLASLRWTDWGDFDVIPANLGTDLASIDDSYRWTVGVARRFSDELVGLASLTYEKDNGSATVSPLGPNDGQIGISVGARYTNGNMNISGGINYTKLGDANAGVGGVPVASFTGNSAIGVGFKVDYKF